MTLNPFRQGARWRGLSSPRPSSVLASALPSAFASVVLAGALLAATPGAQAQQIVPAQSEIVFVTQQMGVPVDGRFKKWSAQITLDPKKAEAGKVSFTIDTASASFGAAETDAEVPKPEWLSAARFPQASFVSSRIQALGGGRFQVTGKLTLKGSTREVLVPVQVTQSGANSTASGSFTIKRLEFKIGEGEWADTSMVADAVQVKFKLALTGLAQL